MDDIQQITGIALGYNAFQSCPKKQADTKKAPAKRGPKNQMSKRDQTIAALETPEEKDFKRRQKLDGFAQNTLNGMSRKADEMIRAQRARENAITALKNVSGFNVQIASPDDSRKTQSIRGKL